MMPPRPAFRRTVRQIMVLGLLLLCGVAAGTTCHAGEQPTAPPAWIQHPILNAELAAPGYWSREEQGLELWPASETDDAQLQRLAFTLNGLPVTRLELGFTAITADSLPSITAFGSLEQLSIPVGIPSTELPRLAPLLRLRSLSFSASQIDEQFPAAIRQLAGQVPLLELRIDFADLPEDQVRPVIERLARCRVDVCLNGTGYPAAKQLVRCCLLVNNIVELGLLSTDIDETDMFYLIRIPRLRKLDLTSTLVTAWGLRSLPALTQLRQLYLPDVAEDSAAELLLQMPQLRGLTNSRCSAARLAEVTRAIPLSQLDERYGQLTDESLAELNLAGSIEQLNLNGLPLTDAAAPVLATYHRLREISLSGTQVEEATARALGHCPQLRTVYLNDTRLSDDGLAGLLQAPRLRVLYADGTRLTAASIEPLAAAPSLEILSVNGTEISLGDLARLRRLRPTLRICNESGQPE